MALNFPADVVEREFQQMATLLRQFDENSRKQIIEHTYDIAKLFHVLCAKQHFGSR